MLFKVIGAGVLICVGLFYFKQSRSRQTLSTSEWVKLMRENDDRFEAARRDEVT
jgi:hypothetical protein